MRKEFEIAIKDAIKFYEESTQLDVMQCGSTWECDPPKAKKKKL